MDVSWEGTSRESVRTRVAEWRKPAETSNKE